MSNEENKSIPAYTRSWLIGVTLILLGFLALVLMLGWLEGLATMALFGGVTILAGMMLAYAYLHPEHIWAGWASYILFMVALFLGVGFLLDFQDDPKYYVAWGVFLMATPFMVIYIRRILLADDTDEAQRKTKASLWWTALVTGGLFTTAAALLQFYLGWPDWLLAGIVTTVFMGGMTFTILMLWLPNKDNKSFNWLIPLMITTGLLTGLGLLLTFDLLILLIPVLMLGFGGYFLVRFFILAYLKKPEPTQSPVALPHSTTVTPYVEQLPPPASEGRALPPGQPGRALPPPVTQPTEPTPLPEKPAIAIDEEPNLDLPERAFAPEDRRFDAPPVLLPESNHLLAPPQPDLPESPPSRPGMPDSLPEEPAAPQTFSAKNTLVLDSPILGEGQPMPSIYTSCDGEQNISPPLVWHNVPAQTKTLALLCVNPDAPAGVITHWLFYNLPPTLTELPTGIVPDQAPATGGIQGHNDFGRAGYDGPNPPAGRPYSYQFLLYALNKEVTLPPDATRQQFMEAIKLPDILAWGTLNVTFQR